MQVKSIAECSKRSILQYFRSSLSYHLSLRALFSLFLSGRLRQVLLYFNGFHCWKASTLSYIKHADSCNAKIAQQLLFKKQAFVAWYIYVNNYKLSVLFSVC